MIPTGFRSAGRLPGVITATVLLLCCAAVGVAQKKDEVTAEQRKLLQTHKQLREQQEKAAEALRRLKRELGAQAAVAGMLPNPLPASLEVTPRASAATPEATGALIQRLASMPEVSEVQGGTEWVERLAQFQRLLQLIGLGIGGVLVLAAVLTVTTATTLVLYARRDELDIMRLVGVPEAVIRLPLLLQGIGQGLLGAILALLGLIVGYRLARPGVEPLVNLTLGLPHMTFLSATAIVTLLGSGALLGAVGGWLAKGRS